MSVNFNSNLLVRGLIPLLQMQTEGQVFDYDMSFLDTIFTLKNNNSSISASNSIELENSDSTGVNISYTKLPLETGQNNTTEILAKADFSLYRYVVSQETDQTVKEKTPIISLRRLTQQVENNGQTEEVITDSLQILAKTDCNSNKIINLASPTQNTDAVNKEYVDTQISSAIAGLPPPASNSGGSFSIGYLRPPCWAPLVQLTSINGMNVTYNTPKAFSSPYTSFLVIHPHIKRKYILVTIDGQTFKTLDISELFQYETTPSTWSITGWFDTSVQKFYLMSTKPSVKLISTKDFEEFSQEQIAFPDALTHTLRDSFYQVFSDMTYIVTNQGVYYRAGSSTTSLTQLTMPNNYIADTDRFIASPFIPRIFYYNMSNTQLCISKDNGSQWSTVGGSNVIDVFLSPDETIYLLEGTSLKNYVERDSGWGDAYMYSISSICNFGLKGTIFCIFDYYRGLFTGIHHGGEVYSGACSTTLTASDPDIIFPTFTQTNSIGIGFSPANRYIFY